MRLFDLFFNFIPHFRNLKKNALPTDGPTDRRTDRPYYRDGRTHLKRDAPLEHPDGEDEEENEEEKELKRIKRRETHLWSILTVKIKKSSLASFSPRQRLTPMPKGIRFSLFLYRASASRCLKEEEEVEGERGGGGEGGRGRNER